MKTILIYDTETTGLPNFNLPSSDPSQPHITQIAAQLCEEETGEVLGGMDFMIRPDGYVIPPELEVLTGITTERALKYGIGAREALVMFMDFWALCDMRVAHNESFDARILRIALMRHTINDPTTPDKWKEGGAFCTLNSSKAIINLPPTPKMLAAKRKGPKNPNLGEAYQFFAGEPLKGAHNAAVDIMACKAVYYGIKNHNKGALK
jgi:DNA polymerase-3 subunit epsilon